MLSAADILVDRAELVDLILGEHLVIVLVIRISELIPGRVNESIHCIGVTSCIDAALGALAFHERFALGKRALTIRCEFNVVGKKYRKFVLRNRYNAA